MVMFIMLLGVTSVMLSGAGSVFREQLHLQSGNGDCFDDIISLSCFCTWNEGLVYVNTVVVPILILFCFLMAGLSFIAGFLDKRFGRFRVSMEGGNIRIRLCGF